VCEDLGFERGRGEGVGWDCGGSDGRYRVGRVPGAAG